MKKSASILTLAMILGVLLLSACRGAAPTPLPDLTLPAPTLVFSEYPAAALAVQTALAEELNLDADEVSIQQVIPALWPDSCLGLGGPDEACLQVITSGYLVILSADGQEYEYRTDLDGGAYRTVPAGLEKPEALDAAIAALARELNTDPALISLIGFTPVEWPDSCLGIAYPETACAEVITPGYRVLLSAGTTVYELHTNQDGSQAAIAPVEGAQADLPVLVLQTDDPQKGCQEIQVTRRGVGTGECGSAIQITAFPGMQRPVELEVWLARYAPIEVSSSDGSLVFNGRGTQQAVLEEQRALIAWTRLVALDAAGEPAESPPGLLIDWRRTGGLAGVCDRLMIFESGFVYARDCQEKALGQTLLQTEQIRLLYQWRDSLASTLVNASDGVTDGFQYELLFNGIGSQPPDDAAQQSMLVLAAQLFGILVQ